MKHIFGQSYSITVEHVRILIMFNWGKLNLCFLEPNSKQFLIKRTQPPLCSCLYVRTSLLFFTYFIFSQVTYYFQIIFPLIYFFHSETLAFFHTYSYLNAIHNSKFFNISQYHLFFLSFLLNLLFFTLFLYSFYLSLYLDYLLTLVYLSSLYLALSSQSSFTLLLLSTWLSDFYFLLTLQPIHFHLYLDFYFIFSFENNANMKTRQCVPPWHTQKHETYDRQRSSFSSLWYH